MAGQTARWAAVSSENSELGRLWVMRSYVSTLKTEMEIDEIKDFTKSLGTLDILARGMSRNDLLLMLHFPTVK